MGAQRLLATRECFISFERTIAPRFARRPTSPPPRTSASSMDEPPMSQISPSAPGQPSSTPWADSRASSVPSITRISRPVFLAHHLAELRPVLGVAHRRGGHGQQGRHLGRLGQSRKAAQRGHRAGLALGVQTTRFGETPGRGRTGSFFVEEIGGAARRAVEDHHPDRVRADVDHAPRVPAPAPRARRTAARRTGPIRGERRPWSGSPSRPRCSMVLAQTLRQGQSDLSPRPGPLRRPRTNPAAASASGSGSARLR